MFGLFKKKPLESEAFGINWADVERGQLMGLNVNEEDENSATPLAYAIAWCDDIWVIKTLINAGADVNSTMCDIAPGGRILDSAIYQDKVKVVKLLIKGNVNITTDSLEHDMSYEMFKLLIDNGLNNILTPDIGGDILFKLLRSLNPNNDDAFLIVKELVVLGANINYKSCIHQAADRLYSDEIILLLLESGANLNPFGDYDMTPFHKAASRYGIEVMKQFIKYGADVNNDVLFEAVYNINNPEIIPLLVKAGADVNYIDHSRQGVTPLHEATFHCESLAIVKSLVECGANINASTYGDGNLYVTGQLSPYTPLSNADDCIHNTNDGTNDAHEIRSYLLSQGA